VIKRSRAAAGWRRRSSERNMSERTAGVLLHRRGPTRHRDLRVRCYAKRPRVWACLAELFEVEFSSPYSSKVMRLNPIFRSLQMQVPRALPARVWIVVSNKSSGTLVLTVLYVPLALDRLFG
jgi:hypothetical protein